MRKSNVRRVASVVVLVLASAVLAGPGPDEPIGPGPAIDCVAPTSVQETVTEIEVWSYVHDMSSFADWLTCTKNGSPVNISYDTAYASWDESTLEIKYTVDTDDLDLEEGDELVFTASALNYGDWNTYDDTEGTSVD